MQGSNFSCIFFTLMRPLTARSIELVLLLCCASITPADSLTDQEDIVNMKQQTKVTVNQPELRIQLGPEIVNLKKLCWTCIKWLRSLNYSQNKVAVASFCFIIYFILQGHRCFWGFSKCRARKNHEVITVKTVQNKIYFSRRTVRSKDLTTNQLACRAFAAQCKWFLYRVKMYLLHRLRTRMRWIYS